MKSFGDKTQKELRAWEKRFMLEREELERVFTSYLELCGETPSDDETAKALAQLRGELAPGLSKRGDVRLDAQHLDEIIKRLDRSIDRTALFDLTENAELGGLKGRLLAAKTVVVAIRAALARRAK